MRGRRGQRHAGEREEDSRSLDRIGLRADVDIHNWTRICGLNSLSIRCNSWPSLFAWVVATKNDVALHFSAGSTPATGFSLFKAAKCWL